MKKIVVVSGLPISENPRAQKEADSLAMAGYDVEVIGAIYDVESAKIIHDILANANWRYLTVLDMSSGSLFEKIRFLFARIRRKFWLLVKKYFSIEVYMQLGYFPCEIYKLAKSRKADLYILHAEESLWAGCQLLKEGFRVAVDIEDWYSEDGLPEDKALKPIKNMKKYESILLTQSFFITTTSNSLSRVLAKKYRCQLPSVVYNSFPSKGNRKKKTGDRQNLSIPSIVWFSQTVGPGRGLEQLINALNITKYPVELHIRGLSRTGFCDYLIDKAGSRLKNNLYFHPKIEPSLLLSSLSEHQIGYCGELSDCYSRDLTITNKMMEYLNAGLAVIATDTIGQKEVAMNIPRGVFLFKQNAEGSLVMLLDELLGDSVLLAAAKKKSKQGFDDLYSWNRSSKLLNDLVGEVFTG